MVKDRWYHQNSIKYSPAQIKWLIPHLQLLRVGVYPHNPKETGYEDTIKSGHGGIKRAPFETATAIAAELDIRLEKAQVGGIILELLYSVSEEAEDMYLLQHMSKMLGMELNKVIYLTQKALSFVSGKRRKTCSFREYQWHKKGGSLDIARDYM